MCSAIRDVRFVPKADTKQPCSRGFACYGGGGANQNNTPARQLDSTPAVALISLRGADRLGVPINLSALSMWNFKFHGALSLALTCGLHEAREGRPGCRYRELL